ncbi:hypothetical protein C2W62_24620 [Candidatus Entotheonella serta]|nr:hypothetical protein C2W62_24620 [Candidatus Entotheonella serta]
MGWPWGQATRSAAARCRSGDKSMGTHDDVIAKRLAETGIEYILGMPGSRASVELIEAAQKLGIHYVLSNNEAAAAVMAATYGILQRRPGC